MFAPDRLLADDTPVPVLDPGRGRTKTGRLWVYAREQRAWGGTEPPAAVYLCAPDRKAERPASHLERFSGVLHVDGYAGFEPLAQKGDVVLAAYWSHTRRKFYDVAQATNAPIAAEALRRTAHFMPSNLTLTVGRLHSGLRLVTVAPSQSSTLCTPGSSSQPPLLSEQSTLAEAIGYALTRLHGLTRFLLDGRIELDTNPVERVIRPVALGRKNHLTAAGSARAEPANAK